MKSRHMFYCQSWILRIECCNIFIAETRIAECVNFSFGTCLLLRKNIQRSDIHISVDQNNLFRSFLNKGNQKFKSVIDLSIEKNLLL